MMRKSFILRVTLIVLFLAGCLPLGDLIETPQGSPLPTDILQITPQPTEITSSPGEMVDYVAQSGDTLPSLASHFNTSIQEILSTNPNIPVDVTTLPSKMPMRIPAYLLPLTGSDFQIVPDSEVINGPSAAMFDVEDEIRRRSGFLTNLTGYIESKQRSAWEVIELVAMDYSIHPRLFLTLLEFQSQALTNPFQEEDKVKYPLGYKDPLYQGLYRQLRWAAERLCNGYYGWRTGDLKEIVLMDGHLTRPNPWQNAGTVAVQNLFAGLYNLEEFEGIVGPDGFIRTYETLWGDPFLYEFELIPANLQQPELILPFLPERIWDFSAGPHYSWGTCLPYGAVDFAPPALESGCAESDQWIAAPADGVVTRSENAKVVLDLDGDGDERTGWVLFFYHVAEKDRVIAGEFLEVGDQIGHPSCEGGRSTGTHFHFARRYNGEWVAAGGSIPIVLDGWVVEYGDEPYLGTMRKGSIVIEACTCTTSANRIYYDFPENP